MLEPSVSARAVRLMELLEGRYAFLGVLGKGGSGMVFEVVNKRLGRKEALKLLGQSLSRHDAQRFTREAQMMAALDHPRIIPIYAFGENAGYLWYSMKLVEGPTLARYLRTASNPDLTIACQVAIPILQALVMSHGRGIVHRDIKPANILLDPIIGPLLTDFGIAKAESDPMQTETGMVLGTPAYVAPEQSLGRKVDGRSDLYALAISLYQLLAGRLPFEEGNSLAIVLQRFQEEAIPLRSLRPDLPEALTTLIAQAMERKPEDRFAHAQAMLDAFLQLAEDAHIRWEQPMALPPGLGPNRSPLPESDEPTASADPTAAIIVPIAGTVTTAPARPLSPADRAQRQGTRTWRSKVLGGILLLSLAGAGVWLTNGWKRAPSPQPAMHLIAPPPVAKPVSKPSQPDAKTPPEPHPKLKAEDPLVTRRAVVPPQLLETPRVILPEGSTCGGRTVTVELQVDEAGAVTSARLLSKVDFHCQESILQAARGCKFKPALASDEKPVMATLAIALEL